MAPKRIVGAAVLLLIGLLPGCKKNSDPPVTGSLCRTTEIKTTKMDFDLICDVDEQLRITGLTTTEDGLTQTRAYSYDAAGKLSDPSGDISTVYKDAVIQSVILDGALFAFNPQGQLTNATLTTDDGTTLRYQYTYDANGDPTDIAGKMTDAKGKTETNNFKLDYVLHRLNGLPGSQQAQFVMLSAIFYGVPLTSKHLLNKWVRTWTADGKTFTFTQQYTYDFDATGRLNSFVHSGNTGNVFNLTYSRCE
jgi:hypothetical protein